LVRRAREGDRDAFDILMTAVVDHLYRIARLILRDFDSAEDAVQEALVRCWRDLPGLRDPDRFDAWLNRLLLNSVTEKPGMSWLQRERRASD
jgi:RNA polymerase sigma-70 factor (ECF subfamily)